MTKILSPQEVHEVAERGLNLLEGDIAILNSMLIESYGKFLIIPHLDFMVFHQDDFKTDLKIVCNHLIESGWSAEYKSCQRDGNWIHVSFSKKNIEFSEEVIEDLKERDKKRHQDIIEGGLPKACVGDSEVQGFKLNLPKSDEELKKRLGKQ